MTFHTNNSPIFQVFSVCQALFWIFYIHYHLWPMGRPMTYVRYYYYPPFTDKETEAQGIRELLCSTDSVSVLSGVIQQQQKLSVNLTGASLRATLLFLSSIYREVGLKKQEWKGHSQRHEPSLQTLLLNSVWERGSQTSMYVWGAHAHTHTHTHILCGCAVLSFSVVSKSLWPRGL